MLEINFKELKNKQRMDLVKKRILKKLKSLVSKNKGQTKDKPGKDLYTKDIPGMDFNTKYIPRICQVLI